MFFTKVLETTFPSIGTVHLQTMGMFTNEGAKMT